MKTHFIKHLFFLLLIIGVTSCNSNNENEKSKSAVEITSLPTSQVCMINDAFMGKEQIPVPVGDKVYYGCCEGCVDKLTNIEETRYAVDPHTGQKVDKADAFIVLKPNAEGTVWYFASKEHYLALNN